MTETLLLVVLPVAASLMLFGFWSFGRMVGEVVGGWWYGDDAE